MNPITVFIRKWWWVISIIGTVIGTIGTYTYNSIEKEINMQRDIKDLRNQMQDQLKNQLTEKDVDILIQLAISDTKQNIRDIQNIMMKYK